MKVVVQQRQSQVKPRAEAGDWLARGIAQVALQHLPEVGKANPTAPQGFAIFVFQEIGGAQPKTWAACLTPSANGRSSNACSVL